MKTNHACMALTALFLTVLSCKKNNGPSAPPDNERIPEITAFTPIHGVPGTAVTITGKNFSATAANNEVTFNGAAAVVTEASATQLKATVPAGAGTGKLRVTVNGQRAVSATDFVVDPLPDGIADFTPKSGPFGTEVTITGRGLPLSPKVKLNGVEGALKSSSADKIIFTIPFNTSLTKHKITVEADGRLFESAAEFEVTAPGKYATWGTPTVPPNAPGANIYPGGISFVYGNRLYWGFRGLAANINTASFHVWDPAKPADGWQMTDLPGIPANLQNATAAVVGNQVLIGNGLPQEHYGQWWAFDLGQGTVTTVAPFAAFNPGMGVSFVLYGMLYASSGLGNTDIYARDANGNWNKMAQAPWRQIDGGNAVNMGSYVLVGPALMQLNSPRNAVFRFYQANGAAQLTRVADFPGQTGVNTPAFEWNGKAYFVASSRVWEFDPANGTDGAWRMVLDEPAGQFIQHVGVINNKVYGWSGRGTIYEFRFRD